MVGRPRQDRSTIRGVTVAVRLPAAVVEALDALVQHEKRQIVEAGLGGTVSRTSLIESLILIKARQVGVISEHMPKDVSVGTKKSKKQSARTPKTKTKERRTSIWKRLRKPTI